VNHADPWDEIARLERQMEVELLAQLEEAPAAPVASKLVESTPARTTPDP
jgi:hypothetical protein